MKADSEIATWRAAALERVASRAAALLAEWCILDVVLADGVLGRIEVWPADPIRSTIAQRLRRLPPTAIAGAQRARTIEAGESALIEAFTAADLDTAPGDGAARELLQELGELSILIVPLTARQHPHGAMTFVSRVRHRRYRPADLESALVFAGHAALIIEYAELSQQLTNAAEASARADAQRRDAETKYALLLEHVTDGLLIAGPRGIVTLADPGAGTLLGVPPQDLVGRRIDDLLLPSTHALAVGSEPARAALNHEYQIRRKNGTLLTVEVQSEVRGGRRHILMRDITALRRAKDETALLESASLAIAASRDASNAPLFLVLHQICTFLRCPYAEVWLPTSTQTRLKRSPVWASTVDGFESFAEASAATVFRRGEGPFGRAWKTKRPIWVHDITAEPTFRRKRLGVPSGVHTVVAIPVLAVDEVMAVLAFFMAGVHDEDASLVRLLSALAAQLAPIMQSRRTEDARLRSEIRFEALVDAIGATVFVLDRRQRYVEVFGAWVTGDILAPGRVLRKTAFEVFGARGAAVHEAAQEQAMTGATVSYEWAPPGAEGPAPRFRTSLTPLRAAGRVIGLLGVCRASSGAGADAPGR
jgi:PAS domain S-box-containing protein